MFRKLHEYWILFSIENWNRCMLNYLHPRKFYLKSNICILRSVWSIWFSTTESPTKLITLVWPRPCQLMLYQTLLGQGNIGWLDSHPFIGYLKVFFLWYVLSASLPFPRDWYCAVLAVFFSLVFPKYFIFPSNPPVYSLCLYYISSLLNTALPSTVCSTEHYE